MAYLHCHSCDWSQDDFYDEHYNPAKYLMNWNEYLFGKKIDERDQQYTDDTQFLRDNGPITTREVIAREYDKFARRIRTMKWMTDKEFRDDPNKLCPKCGADNLDID